MASRPAFADLTNAVPPATAQYLAALAVSLPAHTDSPPTADQIAAGEALCSAYATVLRSSVDVLDPTPVIANHDRSCEWVDECRALRGLHKAVQEFAPAPAGAGAGGAEQAGEGGAANAFALLAATSGNPLMAALANSLTDITATLNQVNDKVGRLEKKVDKVESNCAAGFKSLSAALALNQSRDELLRQKLHQQGYAFIDPSSNLAARLQNKELINQGKRLLPVSSEAGEAPTDVWNLQTLNSINNMKIQDVRDCADFYGLDRSGTKAEIASRIFDHLSGSGLELDEAEEAGAWGKGVEAFVWQVES